MGVARVVVFCHLLLGVGGVEGLHLPSVTSSGYGSRFPDV